jgi:signal transduction histidine kinase
MIVENLVSNAIKYSYPDTIVKVGLRSTPSSVEISVKDQGVGVDEADFEALFEKFNRIENPLSRAEGGSGLGLFLTKRLIEAHGGDIKIESKKDHGTTFIVTLPHITTEAKDEFSLG